MTTDAFTKLKRQNFSKAWKAFPICCHGAWDEQRTTVQALIDAARHELDMFEEEQDGCMSEEQSREVKQFLSQYASQRYL